MNKYLMGIVIYGLGTISTTYASIVSRGFLEEALTNYATSTALDLKADKADLTTLSDTIQEWNKIAGIGDGIDFCSDMSSDAMVNDEFVFDSCYDIRNVSDLIKRLVPYQGGYKENWFVQLLELSTNGYTKYGKNRKIKGLETLTSDIEDLTTKIGALPDGYETVGAALEAINAKVDNKIENLSATASNGKYVLTAVREGDQTTYAWEAIDRSETENTQTAE